MAEQEIGLSQPSIPALPERFRMQVQMISRPTALIPKVHKAHVRS
jgi:hypothetical protein